MAGHPNTHYGSPGWWVLPKERLDACQAEYTLQHSQDYPLFPNGRDVIFMHHSNRKKFITDSIISPKVGSSVQLSGAGIEL